MNKYTIKDLPIEQKRVIIRVDFNVPIEKGKILDDTRIKESLDTITYAVSKGARIILLAHLGRPNGTVIPELTLQPVAKRLEELLRKKVNFIEEYIERDVSQKIEKSEPGSIFLFENLRFYPGEEKGDIDFAKKLKRYGDFYVNDAFSVSHRKHVSIYHLPKLFEVPAAGLLMEKELKCFKKVLHEPEHPFVTLIGGKKIEDKVGAIRNLLPKVDKLLIGGGACFTLLHAKGVKIGDSIFKGDIIKEIKDIINSPKVILPVDFVIAKSIDDIHVKVSEGEVPEGYAGFDIGPKTVELFKKEIENAKLVLWTGPMGVYEKNNFIQGSKKLAEFISQLTQQRKVISLAGGGDTAAALRKIGCYDKFTHVSTGGGASLELLECGSLPGIDALKDKG